MILGNRGISWPHRLIGDGLTLVLDIGNVASFGIVNAVGDNLDATIGKSNSVFSSRGVAVAVLIVSKSGIAMFNITLDSISEVVCWGIKWLRGWDWCGAISGSRGSNNYWSGVRCTDNDWSRGRDDNRPANEDRSRSRNNRSTNKGNWAEDWCGSSNNNRCLRQFTRPIPKMFTIFFEIFPVKIFFSKTRMIGEK